MAYIIHRACVSRTKNGSSELVTSELKHRFINQDHLGSYPVLHYIEPWTISFTLHCPSSLSCTKVYMAIDSGGFSRVTGLHLLNSSQRRRYSGQLSRFTRSVATSERCSTEHLGYTNHAVINARTLFAHDYPPLSIVMCSFMQLNDLEQCRLNARFEIAGTPVLSNLNTDSHATAPLHHCATA